MSELPTKYDAKTVESGRYEQWLKDDVFSTGDESKEPYCIVIPPPNVTGKLHLGHAWDNTLQDIIIRRKRMMGFDALFLPGMDHAGIATQAKVEKRLREEGVSRYELGRKGFLQRAWEWKEEYAKHIKEQWAALGVSVDYSKERFTLDDDLNRAVNQVFISLYDRGMIYRGNRIINWDVEAKTALSNIEVEHVESKDKLYYFRYPFTDGSGHMTIATTRPETMFADQALMVHPEDRRYRKDVGKTVFIPGTDVRIPIIVDDYVDPEFGTGVVKVTPAHDPNDFEVGNRHHLSMPSCMNEDGTMNDMAFQYEGMERFACRKALIDDLDKGGFIERIEDYEHVIGVSERTGAIVEPRLSLQWFVAMENLAEQALKRSETRFIPARFRKVFVNWMTDIQDWCISRQLWWGHRIPAWYKGDEIRVQVQSPGEGWQQDEDVLDTWFSSALWPFSTLGWPEEGKLYHRYYPTDVLVTGYDIIFFWVARMIFQALEFTDKDPFKEVLIHGLIRDSQGRKMSKSLGNGVDPMDVIDRYGVDALRYFLATNSAPGADMRYDETKVESSWNFINKLWNIARFIDMNTEESDRAIDASQLELADSYILSRLNEVIRVVDRNFEKYEFGEVAKELYNYTWDEFASWYVEFAKIALNDPARARNTRAILRFVLTSILKLLHPFIPFVTEKLYLEFADERSIATSNWPKAGSIDRQAIRDFQEIMDTITRVRNLRSEHDVPPKKPLVIHLVIENDADRARLSQQEPYFKRFLNTEKLVIEKENSAREETILLVGKRILCNVLKSGIIDRDKEIETLRKQRERLTQEIARSKSLLENPSFLKKAPEAKVKLEQEKYESYRKQYELVLKKLKG
ncbi:MAG: valine--tRNA ligase [Acholeplasmataceae bacterium]